MYISHEKSSGSDFKEEWGARMDRVDISLRMTIKRVRMGERSLHYKKREGSAKRVPKDQGKGGVT